MKNVIWIPFVAIGLVSCEKPILTEQIVSMLPIRLKTRTDIRPDNSANKKNKALYQYDSLNRVIRIDRDWNDRNVLYQYQNDRLVTRLTQSVQNGQVFFKDTFQYNAAGKMTRQIAVQNGSTWTYEYRYNQAGQLVEIEQQLSGSTYYNLTRYTWQDGNVVYSTEYGRNETKKSEWSYEYDRSANPFRLSPYNPDDPFQFTTNNRTFTRLERDYTGLIDLIVNPIRFAYRYNADRLPAEVVINYGLVQRFEYEPKQR